MRRAWQSRRSRTKCISLPLRPGKEISNRREDQGKGFDFGKILGNGITSDPASEQWSRYPANEAYMDECTLNEAGPEVHMRKRSRRRPFVKVTGWRRARIEVGQTIGGGRNTTMAKEERPWDATNHDRRKHFPTGWTLKAARSAVDFRTEVHLTKTENRPPGTQVRGDLQP